MFPSKLKIFIHNSNLFGHKTSTDLYRSCAALASFSGTFDFKHLDLLLRRFGFDRRFEQTDKINGVWFALIEFGVVWFAYSTDTQTNK